MSEKTKAPQVPSAVERWNHAVREAYVRSDVDADAQAVLEASDEEIERQLLAAGVDLAAEDAKAAATYEAARAAFARGVGARVKAVDDDSDDPRSEAAWVAEAGPRSNVVTMPRRTRRAAWIVYAVAAAAATGGAAYVAGHQRVEVPHHDEPAPTPPEPTAPTANPAPPAPPAPAPAPRDSRKAPHDKAPGDKAPR